LSHGHTGPRPCGAGWQPAADCQSAWRRGAIANRPQVNNLPHPYHGIWRLVNLRPISAVAWLAGPTMTPSLIMSTTSVADIEFRNAIWFALQAASTFALAATILGSLTDPRPDGTPSDSAMSPGPHSAIPMPGIFRFSDTLAR